MVTSQRHTSGPACLWLARSALALAVLLWSGNFVVGRAVAGTIDPLTLNALRWTLALCLLLPLAGPALWRARREIRAEAPRIAALGLSGIAAFHLCVYSALARVPVANALLMLAATPLVILIGSALLGAARLRWRDGVAVLLSAAGVAVLLADGAGGPGGLALGTGDLWMAGAVLAWSTYTLLLRDVAPELPRAAVLAAIMAVGVAVLVPAALIAGSTSLRSLAPGVWASVGYVALGASLVAYLCWSFGVGAVGAESAGFYINLMPLFGAALAWATLGEALGPTQILGGAAIFGAIALRGTAA